LKMMLTEAGHEVVGEAANGMEAYKEYVKTLPDIVTMDITMPVMSGIDAVKKIIASYPDANIIMISALDQRSMVFDALENGAKHYILKPITAEKVLHTIQQVLHQEAAESESAPAAESADAAPAEKAQAAPFEIANRNGVFIITLRSSIGESDLQALGGAVNGFLFIKPLQVIFHFDEADRIGDQALSRIASYAGKVAEAGGIVKTASSSKLLTARLKAIDAEQFAVVYNELPQIVL